MCAAQEIFGTLGPVGEIKIIKDKLTGISAGYGFVQYLDPRAAEMALQSLNGRILHGQVSRTRGHLSGLQAFWAHSASSDGRSTSVAAI